MQSGDFISNQMKLPTFAAVGLSIMVRGLGVTPPKGWVERRSFCSVLTMIRAGWALFSLWRAPTLAATDAPVMALHYAVPSASDQTQTLASAHTLLQVCPKHKPLLPCPAQGQAESGVVGCTLWASEA
jgi:hypothetical protein